MVHIQQAFIDHLLHTGYFARCWKCQDKYDFLKSGQSSIVGILIRGQFHIGGGDVEDEL